MINQLLIYRIFYYIFLVGIFQFVIYKNNFINQMTYQVLMLFCVISIAQFFLVFRKLKRFDFYPFYLADSLIAWQVVKLTGASSSPFILLFPIIALAASLTFKKWLLLSQILVICLFSIAAIGLGVNIFSTILGIVCIAGLGYYLSKSLTNQEVMLVKTEKAKKHLEKLQNIILNNIPSGIISTNTEGKIIQVNPTALEILQIKEDIIGKKIPQIIPNLKPTISELNTLIPTIGSKDLLIDRTTVEHTLKNNEKIQLGFTARRLKDSEDKLVLGTLIIFQDLSKILQLEDKVRRSEKLAAVGKLAASIAHEIRNPLASISGSAQLLKSSEDMSDEDSKLLDIVVRESSRLDDLISEFLVYVRPQKIELSKVDLLKLSNEISDNLKVNSKWNVNNCKIKITNTEGSAYIYGDDNKINQVLTNLLINSSQANAKNIEILIENNELSILDDGVGISKENIKNLFEPFFTTKQKGTGLGLAICYRILESMNAEISVFSPKQNGEQGTEFKILFNQFSEQKNVA